MRCVDKLYIAEREISQSAPTFIIAEAGVNHGGDMAAAQKLIDVAVEAGADAVKFQAFKSRELILANVEKAPYQKASSGAHESQLAMLQKLELNLEQIATLQRYCQSRGIIFLITPFDEVSLAELDALDLPAYKIASTDATNLPFLKAIAQKGKPLLLSTGMCYLDEVRAAVETVSRYNQELVLLQCVANYPIADEQANLNVITTFQREFDVLVGYSDHSVGVGAAPFAVPMGAVVVEKHFTLDKSAPGPDHCASLDPAELREFVSLVRRVESFMGSGTKEPTVDELQTRASLQKSLVARRDIAAGELFDEQNIVAKRTGGVGISPLKYGELIGKAAPRPFTKDEILSL